MRKAAVLFLFVIAISIFVGGVITQSLLILQRVAAVSDVKGMVWIKQRGHTEFAPLADRARVAAGDTLQTKDKSSLALTWLDGTRMRIGPNSQMTVLKCQINTASKAETSLFKLDVGRVWVRVLKILSHKSKFEVKTPTATAGVRGTVFSVAVDPSGKTLVSVKEGAVAVNSDTGQQMVEKGQMAAGAQVGALAGEEDQLWRENESVANPTLTLSEPAPGTKVPPGQSLTVKGQSELDAKVTVNGQPAALKLKGLFEASVTAPKTPGKFEIRVEATDARGYKSLQTVTLEVVR